MTTREVHREVPESLLRRAAEVLRYYEETEVADRLDPRRTWEAAFEVPIKTAAHVNDRRHWRAQKRDSDSEKLALRLAWMGAGRPTPPTLPVHVRFTRIAPRALDADNLRTAPKFIQDELCRCIGLARANGQARDEGDVLRVHHHQECGKPREYAVRVEMWTEEGDE